MNHFNDLCNYTCLDWSIYKERLMNTNLDKRLDELFDHYHLNGIGQGGLTSAEAKAAIKELVTEARIAGMDKAKSRVLRRTEIPADAKEPTRDIVVIIGEECAHMIDDDITELKQELGDVIDERPQTLKDPEYKEGSDG